MNNIIQSLYDADGNRVSVQLTYDEFKRLSEEGNESAQFKDRIRNIYRILNNQAEPTPPPQKKPEPPKEEQEEPALPEDVSKNRTAAQTESSADTKPSAAETTPPIPEPAKEIQEKSPPKPEPVTQAPPSAPASPLRKTQTPLPAVLIDFIATQDPSGKIQQLLLDCTQKLGALCNKRITLSLHRPYICLWDFDEWKTFAFGEIIEGSLHLSIDPSLLPQTENSNVWTPPKGLNKTPLARLKVELITDKLLDTLTRAMSA